MEELHYSMSRLFNKKCPHGVTLNFGKIKTVIPVGSRACNDCKFQKLNNTDLQIVICNKK